MTDRSAFRDKASGTVPAFPSGISANIKDLQPKCRVVLRGYADPHLTELERHSPVSVKSTVHILLQYAASRLSEGWLVGSADISTAFLQGGLSKSRPGQLLMRPPRDAVSQAAGIFPHDMYLVLSAIYGLADSPSAFNRTARAKLKDIGAIEHPLDCMCLMWREHGELACILAGHVDDLLWARAPRWSSIEDLRQVFRYGKWFEMSLDQPSEIVFCGKTICIVLSIVSGVPHRIVMHQSSFTNDLDAHGHGLSMRGRDNPELQGLDLTEYRSTTGCLQWLASSTRIDVAASCSLLQASKPEITNLRGLYEAIAYCKQEPSAGIVFNGICVRDWLLVGFTDASFNNAEGQRSQLGLLVVVAHASSITSTTPSHCSPVEWRSQKSRRVARSTLAAESIAADACVDCLQLLAAMVGIMINNTGLRQVSGYIPFCCATDCRSLHDALASESPSTSERRILIDLTALRDSLREAHAAHPWVPDRLLWVPGEFQLADPLTKLDKKLRMKCTAWMRSPWLQLRGHRLDSESSQPSA
eukprot:5052556-Amphidinium_carterae.2